MITILFERFGNGIYVPHTDLIRSLNRTFSRAGIKVALSQGYNKRMLVKLTQPLPFGIASDEDWVSVDIIDKISCEQMLIAFNENCPEYLRAIYCKQTKIYPNLSAKVNCCSYKVKCQDAITKEDSILALKNGLVLEYEKKGKKIVKDVTNCIYSLEVNNEGIECILGFGTNNLRIDLFCEHINKLCQLNINNEDIIRTKQIIFYGKNFVTSKQYMEGL